MDQNLKLNNNNYFLFSYTASAFIHIIILVICIVLIKKRDDGYSGKVIDVQILQSSALASATDDLINKTSENKKDENPPNTKTDNEAPVNKVSDNQIKSQPLSNLEAKSSIPGYSNFEGAGTDTSGLEQVYAEKTLNVKIKYPVGWTFVDQNNHNKLDGVTFWANNGIFNPPPYIFLEVKEKYLFNPSRYKFSTKLANSVAWYNDPEELEGQVSQVFYIRTETDEDYSIKLIMNGRDTFIAFQPIFFSMIKSFNFGKSLF
jgi:hypothetical protein